MRPIEQISKEINGMNTTLWNQLFYMKCEDKEIDTQDYKWALSVTKVWAKSDFLTSTPPDKQSELY